MFNPDPTLDLVAFGLNIVDDRAPDYRDWTVPALQGCCNDAAGWAMLGALSGLKTTSVVSNYSGEMTSAIPSSEGSGVGLGNLPPYRKVLDCTRAALHQQLAARAGYVSELLREGKDQAPLSVVCLSGHGGQEKYLAETVESMVLSDGLLPDFEFHNLLALFPARARVAIFLDTCHSGGMDRAAKFRYRPKFAGLFPRHDDEGRQSKEVQPKEMIRANIAIFSACPKDATALDGQYNGAFTGAILSVAQQHLTAKTRPSWLEFHAAASAVCEQQFNQSPQLALYGERAVWEKPFLR